MKTRAKKYRIRRSPKEGAPATAQPIAAPGSDSPAQNTDAAAETAQQPVDGNTPPNAGKPRNKKSQFTGVSSGSTTGKQTTPGRRTSDTGDARPDFTSMSTDIEEIKREGLSGRQLRLARRVAQKHNLQVESDFDAIRMLRLKGIDPFQRSNSLELVVAKDSNSAADTGAVTTARAAQAKTNLPAETEILSPAERRDREIRTIQLEIAKRRRRKLRLLGVRLAAFVLFPTVVAGYYFYAMATPMYSTTASLLVIKADTEGSGVGGLFSGTQFATTTEAVTAQDFLQSREAMQALNEYEAFREHFSQPWIDPLQRLDPEASNDEEFKLYKRNVKVGYDPAEGMVRLTVTAADPMLATQFAERLIQVTQARVNGLSQEKRDDQVSYAEKTLTQATQQRRDAQEDLVKLQQQNAILDPQGVIASLRSQISTFELQLQEKELELAALLDNTRPNQAKVDGTQADIQRLQNLIQRLNERMVDASAGENSLASMSVRIQMAQADLATRDLMLQSALQQLESVRLEADKQVRYLTTAVEPVPSDQPSKPRKFENTVLAFLIFSGIYLLCSLTASILREQVSS